MVFLIETLVHKGKLEEVKRFLGFDNCFSINYNGRSDGLVLFWNNDFVLIVQGSQYCIDVKILENMSSWRMTGYYGVVDSRRRVKWNLFRALKANSNKSWLCFGDFNDLAAHSKKWRGCS